jgi:stage II sporulation protein P
MKKMEQHPIKGALPSKEEPVSLDGTYRTKYRGFAVILICCALLLAAFAVSAVWMRSGEDRFSGLGSFWERDTDDTTVDTTQDEELAPPNDSPPDPDSVPLPEASIPADATPVISMDLSYLSLGSHYIHNETPYAPNPETLLNRDFSHSEKTEKPLVLILHTHTGESYLPTGTAYITAPLGDLTYTDESTQNMLAVGEVLCRTLNENGITAIHCTVIHDSPTFSGSYSRAAESIQKYLEIYPSIEYVIDLHRDAVVTSKGEIVRSVAETAAGDVAQIMAVVGTDANGTRHERWEDNLALALKLRQQLNLGGANVCRPVSLRNASFNQELAKHSLLLEIGTAANSLDEAKRAAVLLGKTLAEMLSE